LIPLPISYKSGVVEEGIEVNGSILRREVFQNIPEQILSRSVKYLFAIYSKFKNLFINKKVNGAISFAFFCVFIATYLMIRSALIDFLI
jgi:predicted glycosyltransferase